MSSLALQVEYFFTSPIMSKLSNFKLLKSFFFWHVLTRREKWGRVIRTSNLRFMKHDSQARPLSYPLKTQILAFKWRPCGKILKIISWFFQIYLYRQKSKYDTLIPLQYISLCWLALSIDHCIPYLYIRYLTIFVITVKLRTKLAD